MVAIDLFSGLPRSVQNQVRWINTVIGTRPHQEYFGKGITRVYFSGIYSYSRDFSVLPQHCVVV